MMITPSQYLITVSFIFSLLMVGPPCVYPPCHHGKVGDVYLLRFAVTESLNVLVKFLPDIPFMFYLVPPPKTFSLLLPSLAARLATRSHNWFPVF